MSASQRHTITTVPITLLERFVTSLLSTSRGSANEIRSPSPSWYERLPAETLPESQFGL
jgi:hypothetical protein